MAKGADDFIQRTLRLQTDVGIGDITAGCVVDQPYAQDQHETLHYRHISGGQARYLGGPLLVNARDLISAIARDCITDAGPLIVPAMIRAAETLAGYVAIHAPIDTGRLRESGAPYVTDNGVEVYRRPALAPRERG